MKVALLTNYTSKWLARALNSQLVSAQIHAFEYNEILIQISSEDSELSTLKPDFVVLSLLWEDIENQVLSQSEEVSHQQLDSVEQIVYMNYEKAISFARRSHTQVIFLTIPTITMEGFDVFDENSQFGNYALIARLNQRLSKLALDTPKATLINMDRVIGEVGRERFYDYVKWYAIKQPFKKEGMNMLARSMSRVINASYKPRKKVLVLDLDHTMWHGTLAESGVSQLKVGHEGISSVFRRLQYFALKLKRQGVLLAVLSKNDEQEALAAIDSLDQQLIRTADLAAYSISWDPKSQGIEQIAQELNLGLDSFVFLDDNPFERKLIETQFPEVTVLPFPDDVSRLPRTLTACIGFDTIEVTDEDLRRADQYKIKREIDECQRMSSTFDDFVRSLDQAVFVVPAEDHLNRVSQLINKSNQFNMTTIRRSPEEIQRLIASSQFDVRPYKLTDRFTDHGIVSVVILKIDLEECQIDTFIMSCRVLGRTVERLIMRDLLETARRAGCHQVNCVWKRTEKNIRFSDFYETCGFKISAQGEEQIDYTMPLSALIEAK